MVKRKRDQMQMPELHLLRRVAFPSTNITRMNN